MWQLSVPLMLSRKMQKAPHRPMTMRQRQGLRYVFATIVSAAVTMLKEPHSITVTLKRAYCEYSQKITVQVLY